MAIIISLRINGDSNNAIVLADITLLMEHFKGQNDQEPYHESWVNTKFSKIQNAHYNKVFQDGGKWLRSFQL